MTITVADLKIFQSERMADNADGGGRMTANAVVSGAENQIFDDVTDVDRAAGDVSIRKVFAAVTSANTDKYLDAGVCVFSRPADPAVSVAAFSTGDFYDERDDLRARLEQTISRGARWHGWLWGQHLEGQRAVVLWQRVEAELPAVGFRLELVAKAGTVEQYTQFLWITRVQNELRNIYEGGTTYQVREVTCEIAEPLTEDYLGSDPSKNDPSVSTLTALLYETRYNAEAVPLFGVMPTTALAETGDFSVSVDDLYLPIIPTSLTETALPDVNPAGDSPTLVAGNASTINFSTTTQSIKPSVALYCGTGIYPGTLSIAVSGSTITDDNGKAMLATTHIGDVDYGNGIVTWNDACPDYSTASKTVTFTPASRPLQVSESAAQIVTAENQGFVWAFTLSPVPSPGSLRVSYRVANKWYVISDQGGGQIKGADSSYGSGQLNFSTGTVTWTAGGIPDVNSEIIYAWTTPALYTPRGGAAVDAPVIRGQTEHGGLAPNSVTLEWDGDNPGSLADDGVGNLTGSGGVGAVNYATGAWWVRPTYLPVKGLEFTITYDWGAPIEETFAHPLREPNAHLALALANTNLKPGAVEVEWNVLILDYDVISEQPAELQLFRAIDPIKTIRDDGAGALPISGGTDGAINYTAGTLDFLPDVTVSIPEADYSVVQIGTSAESGGTKPVYRNSFVGFVYKNAGAVYPDDTSGYVKVRYRVVGGDTSASEVVAFNQAEFDVTKGYAETCVPGSLRFTLSGSAFVEANGLIVRDPLPDTGAGTTAGTIDPVSGRVRLSSWIAGANTLSLTSLLTSMDVRPVEEVVFRTPVAPIKSGTLQFRYTTLTGVAKSKVVDGSGLLEDSDCMIRVDYPLGIVRVRFGLWKVDADLTPEQKAEPWYDADARVDFGGTLKIWFPKPALDGTMLYNAVAQTTIPPDSTLLGLNAARLPPDGKALIFNAGRLVLVHHSDAIAQGSLSPTQVIDCGRVRLYRVAIEDAGGQRLPASFFTVDRELGTVTMSPALDLTGYTSPYAIIHTVADLARLTAVDINGTLSLNKPLSHDYPADDSRVSGVLFAGTLQARVSTLFAQSTWTSVWSDALIGSEPLAQYNDAQWPIVVSNLGAYPDRILVQFTSATAFNVIGENLGLIGTGTTSVDCAPVNSLTGQPYFTIPYQGWGAGWATGNCLRFNLIGAAYPVDLIRAVQPSEPTGQDPDSVELLLIGNVDA
ncbi:MAG: hypothetical protein KDJ54_06415 [Candidatus Competibacteraceae bacterium]|nr:hypothetical protein [Candidatus Competibacteraceae bacterium]